MIGGRPSVRKIATTTPRRQQEQQQDQRQGIGHGAGIRMRGQGTVAIIWLHHKRHPPMSQTPQPLAVRRTIIAPWPWAAGPGNRSRRRSRAGPHRLGANSAAVELILESRGRVIVSGIRQVGPHRAQAGRHLRQHRHPGLFRTRRRGRARRPGHDHPRRRADRPVELRRATNCSPSCPWSSAWAAR
jgi:hypothetical protein